MTHSRAPILLLTPDPAWADDAEEIVHQLERFRALGLAFDARPWSEPGPLGDYGLVTPLMAWGYHQSPDAWQDLLDTLDKAGVTTANPVAVLRWNGDKAYLGDLADCGVAIVPTQFIDALAPAHLDQARAAFGTTDLVIKPPVSGGADGTFLLQGGAPAPEEALGKRMLVQPMMPAIASEGEFSLFHFGGMFSHAVLKTPRSGDFRVQAQFGGTDVPVDPPAEAVALANAALAAAPGPILYARIDMVRATDGGFRLMELELIEPYLWLDRAPDGGRRCIALMMDAARAK